MRALLPYFFFINGLKNIEAGKASILACIELVVATALGITIFGDSISLYKILGIVLIIAAIILLNLKSAPTF